MPPTNRFNASEAALALALRAGEGQAFSNRFQQGQQLVQNARAQMNAQNALQLEQRRIELQSQQARLGAATPTRRTSASNPFTRSTVEQNAEFKSPENVQRRQGSGFAAGVDDQGNQTQFSIDDQGNLSGTAAGEDLSPSELKRRGGFAGAGRTVFQNSKQGFLDSLTNLDPAARQALGFLVKDDEIDLQQFAIRANSLKESSALSQVTRGQNISNQRSFIREQVDDIDKQIRQIENEFSDNLDINIVGRTPADLLGEFNTAASPRLQRATGGLFGGGGQTEDQQRAQQLFQRLTELRAQKDQLRGQEQSVIAGDVDQLQQGQVPDGPGAGPGSSATELSDEELRKLAGL